MSDRCGWVRRRISLFLAGVGVAIGLAAMSAGLTACSSASASSPVEVTLVSFAVTRAAYEKIIPQFEAQWLKDHGQAVSFSRSYGGSGSQARAVMEGLQADVVALALALDINKIQKEGLIAEGWEKRSPNNSVVHRSVAALVTREGNPKNITTWADLAQDHVRVVTANPKTSGGARWNFLGLWGSITQTGGDDAAALKYTTQVFKNAPVLPRDAREATDVFFNQGQGDVLINYENEVLLAKQNGKNLPYTVPEVNISIDSPVTVVDQVVDKRGTREVAEAFVKYLFTPTAQQAFAEAGFRPVDEAIAAQYAAQYPQIKTLFTIKDFGGWSAAQKKFFADDAVFDKIQAQVGQK